MHRRLTVNELTVVAPTQSTRCIDKTRKLHLNAEEDFFVTLDVPASPPEVHVFDANTCYNVARYLPSTLHTKI